MYLPNTQITMKVVVRNFRTYYPESKTTNGSPLDCRQRWFAGMRLTKFDLIWSYYIRMHFSFSFYQTMTKKIKFSIIAQSMHGLRFLFYSILLSISIYFYPLLSIPIKYNFTAVLSSVFISQKFGGPSGAKFISNIRPHSVTLSAVQFRWVQFSLVAFGCVQFSSVLSQSTCQNRTQPNANHY